MPPPRYNLSSSRLSTQDIARVRVVVIGAFAPEYARQYTLFEGLRQCGVTLDLRPFPKTLRTPGRLRAVAATFPRPGEADAVFIPAFNQLIGPQAAALGRLRGVPVLIIIWSAWLTPPMIAATPAG
jgi:hypothetical protein